MKMTNVEYIDTEMDLIWPETGTFLHQGTEMVSSGSSAGTKTTGEAR